MFSRKASADTRQNPILGHSDLVSLGLLRNRTGLVSYFPSQK